MEGDDGVLAFVGFQEGPREIFPLLGPTAFIIFAPSERSSESAGNETTALTLWRRWVNKWIAAGSVFNSALLMKSANKLGNSQKLAYICTN